MEGQAQSPLVLVVDDDDDIRDVLVRLLESEGCRVLSARFAEDAIALSADEEPAVALLDIVLPRMDGLALAGEIRTRWPDCRCIMITGQSSVDTAIEAIHQGAVDYLSKPFFPLDNVWAAVQRALATREVEKNKRALIARRQEIKRELRAAVDDPKT